MSRRRATPAGHGGQVDDVAVTRLRDPRPEVWTSAGERHAIAAIIDQCRGLPPGSDTRRAALAGLDDLAPGLSAWPVERALERLVRWRREQAAHEHARGPHAEPGRSFGDLCVELGIWPADPCEDPDLDDLG